MNAAQKPGEDSVLVAQVYAWLAEVLDPEIPVVSVIDLGIVRDVSIENEQIVVCVAPTYTGCPATEVIEDSIASFLRDKGLRNVVVRRTLSPPWSSRWITPSGRNKLRAYGIVPPEDDKGKRALLGKPSLRCPRCDSQQTSLISEFGSTACKASWRCDECLEPFEYFKCI